MLLRHAVAAWVVFLALAALVSAVHAVVAPWPIAPQAPLSAPRWSHPQPPPSLSAADDADAATDEFDDEMIMFGEVPPRRLPSPSQPRP